MNDVAPPAFTDERRRTLHAVVARILPGTDGPGAARTGAAAGFERALQHPSLRGLRPAIESLLDRLQARTLEVHACDFHACGEREQDALLDALARDPNPWSRLLFRMVIAFSLEGLLGDPLHGGNRDFEGWKALGLTPEAVRAGLCRAAGAA